MPQRCYKDFFVPTTEKYFENYKDLPMMLQSNKEGIFSPKRLYMHLSNIIVILSVDFIAAPAPIPMN